MAEPFLGEIRIMSFGFAPRGWAQCSGQLLPINQNQALFSLLGTSYGGNGQTNFALPDMRGRTPLHVGAGLIQGQSLGEERHTLSQSEMPQHNHSVTATSANGNVATPANNFLANRQSDMFVPAAHLEAMNTAACSSVGGSQPHENMNPFLVLNFAIALIGIFPSRN